MKQNVEAKACQLFAKSKSDSIRGSCDYGPGWFAIFAAISLLQVAKSSTEERVGDHREKSKCEEEEFEGAN